MGKKIILTPILIIISTCIFLVLDNGGDTTQTSLIIQPILFGISFTISILFSSLRKYLMILSVILLSFMILIYLFQRLDISNWLGSLGFGMLFVTVLSYLPQFIKRGYIEKY